MHIKPGTWEASGTVCETDPLCDTSGLVSPPKSEPQIRNRRVAPGSGNCGGGGGGTGRPSKDSCQREPPTLDSYLHRHRNPHASIFERERRNHTHSRNFRREMPRGVLASERRHRGKDRWVEDSLLLLKPPPAFPVQDSPAKLQPAVSYASKVKLGGVGSILEDPPGIEGLLHNQWGLSFISDSASNSEMPDFQDSEPGASPPGQTLVPLFGGCAEPAVDTTSVPEAIADRTAASAPLESSEEKSPGDLLLGCPHLVAALLYHTEEWDCVNTRHNDDPSKVVWYRSFVEHPA